MPLLVMPRAAGRSSSDAWDTSGQTAKQRDQQGEDIVYYTHEAGDVADQPGNFAHEIAERRALLADNIDLNRRDEHVDPEDIDVEGPKRDVDDRAVFRLRDPRAD